MFLHKNRNIVRFTAYSALNTMSSSCSFVLSSNSMLDTIAQNANSHFLSYNYVGKDIIGQLGSLFYIWKKGSVNKNSAFKAGLFQQLAYALENSAVYLTQTCTLPTLPILGTASLMKNISFVFVGGITIKKLTELTANQDIGPVYTKITAINTLASTMGMLVGLLIIYVCPSYTIRSIAVLPILGLISIYSLKKLGNL